MKQFSLKLIKRSATNHTLVHSRCNENIFHNGNEKNKCIEF